VRLTDDSRKSQAGLAADQKIQGAWLDPHLRVENGRFRGGDG